jgi:hypothetical protein
VGEPAMAAPAPGAVDAVHAGAVPAEPMLEVAAAASAPVRQLTSRRNPRGCSVAWWARPGWPLRGIATAPRQGGQLLVDGGLVIAAVGGDRCWMRPAPAAIRVLAGASSGAAGVADLDLVVEHPFPSGWSATGPWSRTLPACPAVP